MEPEKNNPNTSFDSSANEKAEEMSEFFIFELEGELFAVLVTEIDRVMKVPPVTTVPNAPDSLVGVFHLRGKVIVVLDLFKRMHLVHAKALVPNYLFIVHYEKNYFGILIDQIKNILRIPIRQITPLESLSEKKIPLHYTKGMFTYEELPQKVSQKTHIDFMIKPKSGEAHLQEEKQLRSVIFLNIQEILNQNDLLGIIPPQ
jgi:purine-binding chemotaxis protein CheW